MLQASLRYGIQKAAEGVAVKEDNALTVGQQIEQLLDATTDGHVGSQVRSALQDPQAIIEFHSGQQVQTVTQDMPLRELLAPAAGAFEITVSKPHVGG